MVLQFTFNGFRTTVCWNWRWKSVYNCYREKLFICFFAVYKPNTFTLCVVNCSLFGMLYLVLIKLKLVLLDETH